MDTMTQEQKKHPDGIVRALMRVDSSIRNGQFLYAYREANKLLAEATRGEYSIEKEEQEAIVSSIKRTILFLRPIIESYAQNQASLDIARRILKCRKNKAVLD